MLFHVYIGPRRYIYHIYIFIFISVYTYNIYIYTYLDYDIVCICAYSKIHIKCTKLCKCMQILTISQAARCTQEASGSLCLVCGSSAFPNSICCITNSSLAASISRRDWKVEIKRLSATRESFRNVSNTCKLESAAWFPFHFSLRYSFCTSNSWEPDGSSMLFSFVFLFLAGCSHRWFRQHCQSLQFYGPSTLQKSVSLRFESVSTGITPKIQQVSNSRLAQQA